MSAPDLLVVIDPVARATDGESVRIARDVLCAGAGAGGAKVCVPECAADVERALARRGSRRPVVVGDDRALLRTVRLLYRERELSACALAVVPVGPPDVTVLARALGVPGDAVAASRVALNGTDRARDLLVDDSGGVVLGALRVPARAGSAGGARGADGAGGSCGPGAGPPAADGAGPGEPAAQGDRVPEPRPPAREAPPGGGAARGGAVPGEPGADGGARGTGARGGADGPGAWAVPRHGSASAAAGYGQRGGHADAREPLLRVGRSLVRTLARPLPLLGALAGAAGGPAGGHGPPLRLRVEADGATLADLDRPVVGVWLAPGGDGLATVAVRRRATSEPLYARARTVTVSGPDFRYRADALVGGPVRARTWTAMDSAWWLTLPGPAAGDDEHGDA